LRAQSEAGSTANLASGAGQEWLGNSVWQSPKVEISRVRSWASLTAMSYRRGEGESTWRGDRSRIVLMLDQFPSALFQVEQGPTWQTPPVAAGTLVFYPPGLTVRTVHPTARFVQAVWDMDLYSALLPELGAAASGFE